METLTRRKQGGRRLLAGALLLTVCAAAYWGGIVRPHEDVPFSVDGGLDFGEVWEDRRFEWKLPISNRCNKPIEIEGFSTSCSCVVSVVPSSLTLPAGQSKELNLVLDLSRSRSSQQTKRNVFSATITPRIKGLPLLTGWVIRGRVRLAVNCDPSFLDFSRRSELAQPFPPQRVTVTASEGVQALSAACRPPILEVKVVRKGPRSNCFELTALPRDRFPRGDMRCIVDLFPILADGKRLPPKELEVLGRIVADVEASPPTISFGAHAVGTDLSDTITLRSLCAKAFAVRGVRCQGDGLSVKRADGNGRSGAVQVFRIKQIVGRAGECQGRVFFNVRPAGGNSEVDVAVPVSYIGATR